MSDNQGSFEDTHKHSDAVPNLKPTQFPTVHIDNIKVANDYIYQGATVTLLQYHVIPKTGKEGWRLEGAEWEIVGELKMTLATLTKFCYYYIQAISNGLDIRPIVQKYLEEHPRQHPEMITWGPGGDITRNPEDVGKIV